MESLKRRFIYTETPLVAAIYYGTGTTTTVSSFYILSTFATATGTIGTPTGRLYTFGTAFGTYRYWAIPDLPNTGERVVSMAKYADGITVLGMQPPEPFYSYYQQNPTPASQSIQYGKLDINGVIYRLYRTASRYGASNNRFLIYSFY